MELIEATAGDLDDLVDRWYSLARAMEAYDELNELSDADVDEISDDGFRAHLEDEEITDYLIVLEARLGNSFLRSLTGQRAVDSCIEQWFLMRF
jgi:hypothetical protein